MNVRDAIINRRSIRKFTDKNIGADKLTELVDLARLAAYGGNMQPLKFKIISDKSECDAVFPKIKWAAYLENGTPKEDERPNAYIAVLGDTSIKNSFEVEAGAAVTTMMLEAVEMGLASCWLGAIDRDAIHKALKLPENLNVIYLLALGHPAQQSRAVEMRDGDVKYFLDDEGVMNVPKRSLRDILLK